MLTTNTNFDAKHNLLVKTPMYLVQFDGEDIDYCNHFPSGTVQTYPTYDTVNIGSQITLSGGNLVATKNVNGGYKIAKSSMGKSIGKWYCEFTYVRGSGSDGFAIGVGNDSMGLEFYIGADANGWGGLSNNPDMDLYTNGGKVGDYGDDIANGAIVGVALDMDNGKVWFAVNGVWGSRLADAGDRTSGNPAAGLYPAFSGLTGTIYVAINVFYLNDAVTANFGGSAFTYGPPDGFSSGLFNIIRKKYLVDISGVGQSITPEEGRSSISAAMVTVLDYDNEITALLATDNVYFHRKKTTIKAGYMGMSESDMLTIFVGWVTGIKLSSDATSYVFDITDPQKWMQRKIFRGAETTPVTIQGNPINIILQILTSTGNATNGNYDVYPAENGLGIEQAYVNVSGIETVRDKWFPGDSHYMKFTLTERITAIDFLEKEIFLPLNLYPIIDGQGRFGIKPFKPPLTTVTTIPSFTDDNVVGIPFWDSNLKELINEVEFNYNYDGSNFLNTDFYVDGTSLNARGPGKKPITIKSKGFHTNIGNGSIADVMIRRKNSIFFRYSVPPLRISFRAFFSKWTVEVGDVVAFTNKILPDITAGTRGLTADRMEIISRNVNWKKGTVDVELLDTGFAKAEYAVISPAATITVGTSATQFTISTGDATKFDVGDEIEVLDSGMRSKAANVTILTLNTTTGVITCDNIGSTPAAGWKIQYAKRSVCTTAQQKFAFMIGTASNPITP